MARNIYFWVAAIWSVLVVFACLVEVNSIPMPRVSYFDIPNRDKLAHFIFYFVFSILWCKFLLLKDKDNSYKNFLIVFLIALIFGGLVEIMQYYFTKNRSAEWTDFLSNCLGSFIGLSILYLFTSIKKNNKASLQ